MRRLLAALAIALALVVPGTAAHAEPAPAPPATARVLWPLCAILGDVGVCVPP